MAQASAINGVAVVAFQGGGSAQVTIAPEGATGTATIEGRPALSPGFETLRDESGSPLTGLDLSGQATWVITGRLESVRVTSTNAADAFDIYVYA